MISLLSIFALLAVLAGSPPEDRILIKRCASEFYPVGTGIPGVPSEDEKSDKNLIVSVSKVTHVSPRGKHVTTLGYAIHTADGTAYYEFGGGLDESEQAIERAFLKRAGTVRIAGSHLEQFVRTPGRAFMKLSIPAAAFVDGVALTPCTKLH